MIHLKIKETIEKEFVKASGITTELYQDALLVHLANGVDVEIRFADQKQYAINWQWGEAALYINTAPLYPDLASYPNHFCDADGNICADLITDPENEPWNNVTCLLKKLTHDPLLEQKYNQVYKNA